jgi:multicomponent Na+:H+ antiporter subunit D
MAAAMLIFTALCILIGIFPETFYQFLPYATDYVPYKAGKVLFYLQLLLFSGLAFFLLLPLMRRTLTISLDVDWLWRVALYRVAGSMLRGIAFAGRVAETRTRNGVLALRDATRRHLGATDGGNEHGVFARNWPIGTTALWIAVLLSIYVLTYFI